MRGARMADEALTQKPLADMAATAEQKCKAKGLSDVRLAHRLQASQGRWTAAEYIDPEAPDMDAEMSRAADKIAEMLNRARIS